MKSRWRMLLGAAALAVASLTPTTQAANAAHYDAVCDIGEVCFYYNSRAYKFGSMADFQYNMPSFRGHPFITAGKGQGKPVWNNAAHVWNRGFRPGRVYRNSNYQGKYDTVGTAVSRDLFLTKNDNASWKWI